MKLQPKRQEKDIDNMLRLKMQGYSYGAIGALYGISRQRVHQLISGYHRNNQGLHGNGWYRRIQEQVFRRDGHVCQKCGSRGNLVAHHINGDDHDNALGNLITLCNRCHLDLHRPEHHIMMPTLPLKSGAGGALQSLHRVLVDFRRNWRFYIGL